MDLFMKCDKVQQSVKKIRLAAIRYLKKHLSSSHLEQLGGSQANADEDEAFVNTENEINGKHIF